MDSTRHRSSLGGNKGSSRLLDQAKASEIVEHTPAAAQRGLPRRRAPQFICKADTRRDVSPRSLVELCTNGSELKVARIVAIGERVERMTRTALGRRIDLPTRSVSERQARADLPGILRENGKVAEQNRAWVLRLDDYGRRQSERSRLRRGEVRKLVVTARSIVGSDAPPIDAELELMAAGDERQAVDDVVLPLGVGYILAEVVTGVDAGRNKESAESVIDINVRWKEHVRIERRLPRRNYRAGCRSRPSCG